jgi:hypothetical protein
MEIIVDFTPDRPEVADMNPEELRQYWQEIEDKIADLDEEEPEDMDSEAYDDWADRHETLEDIRDEIEERLEEFGE